jgi:hypothetical protein
LILCEQVDNLLFVELFAQQHLLKNSVFDRSFNVASFGLRLHAIKFKKSTSSSSSIKTITGVSVGSDFGFKLLISGAMIVILFCVVGSGSTLLLGLH